MRLKWDLNCLYGNKEEYEKEKNYLKAIKENSHEILCRYEKILVSSYLYILEGQEEVEIYNFFKQKYYSLYAKLNGFSEIDYDEDILNEYQNYYNKIFENGIIIKKHINQINSQKMRIKDYIKFTDEYLAPNCITLINTIRPIYLEKDFFYKIITHIEKNIKTGNWIRKSLDIRKLSLEKNKLELVDFGVEINNFGEFKLNFLKRGIKEFNPKELNRIIDEIFNKGWIDIDSKNDNMTIFSDCFHPFIMSNFNGSLISSLQLTHEIGHVLNDYLKINQELYEEILPIVEEIMLYKYIEINSQNKEEIHNLVIDRCIIDMIFFILKIKLKLSICTSNITEEEINNTWLKYLKEFFGEEILYLDEDQYQWMLINFSSSIISDLSYVIGHYLAFMVYRGKIQFDNLIESLKNGLIEKSLINIKIN